MQFQAEIAETGFVETILDYFESCEFLRYKENSLSVVQCRTDQICYCLRFARAWRTLNDKVPPAQNVDDGTVLTAIRILD